MARIEVDGKKVEAPDGSTVLEVLGGLGIKIPKLCYHPALRPYGACRLCLVEIEQRGRPTLVTSCSYPIRDGLVVRASSETVLSARRGMMELLLARCPESDALRKVAEEMGVEGTRFPKITEAQEDCVLCGLCIQVCTDVIGPAAISFADRGVNRAVAVPFQISSEDCLGCGACAVVCPAGTIKLHPSEDRVEVSPFKSSVELRRCIECGAILTGEPFGKEVAEKLKNSEIAKNSAMLCDECKRKRAATISARLAVLSDGRRLSVRAH